MIYIHNICAMQQNKKKGVSSSVLYKKKRGKSLMLFGKREIL